MAAARHATLRKVAAVGFVTVALSGAFVGLRLARANWDASRFVYAGDKEVNVAQAPKSLYVYPNSFGFDGIMFYGIALDPFAKHRTIDGITLDLPAFRFQRIVYPALVYVSTGGDPSAVAWGLIAWNLAGMGALGCLGALLAMSSGRDSKWGFTLGLAPAFAISLGLDTAEVLAACFLFAGLLLLRNRRFGWATAALSIAALTRETTLIVCAGGILIWFWRRARGAPDRGPSLWAFLTPAVVEGLWQIALWRRWGKLPVFTGRAIDFGFPLRGFLRAFNQWIPPSTYLHVFNLALIFAIGVFLITVAISMKGSSAPAHEKAAWVLTALMIPFFQFAVWFHHWGFMRALSEMIALGTLIILGNEKAPAHRLWFWVAVWASIALQLALYP